MSGPSIGAGAQLGVNVTVLPYVRIGAGCLVGAGSVVTRDLPPGAVAYGNPAVVRGRSSDLGDIAARVDGGRRTRSRGSGSPRPAERRTPTVTPMTSGLDGGSAAYRQLPLVDAVRGYAAAGLEARAGPDVALVALLLLVAPLLLAVYARGAAHQPGPGPVPAGPGRACTGGPSSMLKFRTMRVDCDRRPCTGTTCSGCWPGRSSARTACTSSSDDPRVTRWASWLRRRSLDELPQLLNVLRGRHVAGRAAAGAALGGRELFPGWARPRFDVRPGITGLWQVSGRNRLTMLAGAASSTSGTSLTRTFGSTSSSCCGPSPRRAGGRWSHADGRGRREDAPAARRRHRRATRSRSVGRLHRS